MNVTTNEEAVNALLNYGSVAVGIAAQYILDLDGVQNTFSVNSCGASPPIDHAVNIVGWRTCQVCDMHDYACVMKHP